MIFRFAISTPANTAEAAAVKTVMPLSPGTIHKLDIMFPAGCDGLLHVRIMDALHQVWPSNPDESFAADAEVISFPEQYQILDEPYELHMETWNEDTTYAHVAYVRIGILAPIRFLPTSPLLARISQSIGQCTPITELM